MRYINSRFTYLLTEQCAAGLAVILSSGFLLLSPRQINFIWEAWKHEKLNSCKYDPEGSVSNDRPSVECHGLLRYTRKIQNKNCSVLLGLRETTGLRDRMSAITARSSCIWSTVSTRLRRLSWTPYTTEAENTKPKEQYGWKPPDLALLPWL